MQSVYHKLLEQYAQLKCSALAQLDIGIQMTNLKSKTMSFLYFIFISLATLGLDAAPESVSITKTMNYGAVTLVGKIKMIRVAGPPNYGESPDIDTDEKILVLSLEEPINISNCQDGEIAAETLNGVAEVQLVFYDTLPFDTFFLGKRITIAGELFEAMSGHHHYPALLSVESITFHAVRGSQSTK